jgi:hypothetical protein
MSENETANPMPDVEATPEMGEEPRSALETFLHHQRRAIEETGKALDALLPAGFKEHGSEATKEFVKGFRVLVDALIDEVEKASRKGDEEGEEAERPSTTGRTKVKVQVE